VSQSQRADQQDGAGPARHRAIVLGGSMAGLLAARVLAESFDEVLVVDRDELTGVTAVRRGVPQGRHVHGLLARGQQILEELFPGFTEDAIASGIPTGDLGELRWFFGAGRLQPATTGLICISASRPVLEAQVRARVGALAKVTLVERTDIVDVTASEDNSRITGAVIHRHGEAAPERLRADLVVDATGRGSRTPVWLAKLGYERPAEEQVRIDVSYTSKLFRLPDESVLGGDLSINPVATPVTPRGAFLSRIEDGKIAVSLYGIGESAPTDAEGFLAFAKSLAVQDVHEVLQGAEPLGDAHLYRYQGSVRRRYEQLARFPQGYLVLGDAACSFNPVYGQGMTVAAMEAATLREHLAGGLPDAADFHRAIAEVIDVCWQTSVSGDLSYPQVEGPRPPEVEMANAYIAQLHAAATVDGELTRRFMRVAGLADPPSVLMSPDTMERVARNAPLSAPPTGSATPASPAT
jgi:2-polyprenyl-6-methoxyphenol hydroxylase-like FAD-dependent oxidoreductase